MLWQMKNAAAMATIGEAFTADTTMQDFSYNRRIAFHETDAAGIVHYAQYFHLAEEAETRALHLLEQSYLDGSYLYPRVHVEADYSAPLHFFEEARVQSRLLKVGRSTLHWEFLVYGERGLCATIRHIVARRHALHGTPAPFSEEETQRFATSGLCPEP